jgi:hypothetical protein
MMTFVPIDAETRGRLRQFKMELAKRYGRLERLIDAPTGLVDDANDIAMRSSVMGRQRAFDRVRRALAVTGAALEGVRLDGGDPIAIWSILRPRIAVAVDPDDPAKAQDCITVNYILAGRLPDDVHRLGEGLWTLELPDHAAGRLMQRRVTADPATNIHAAHRGVLRLRRDDVAPGGRVEDSFHFLLPAGPGAFICSLAAGFDMSVDEPSLHVRAHTWLDDDQLRDDQTPLVGDGLPGERLGDGWLLPDPLRMIQTDDDGTGRLMRWAPGLPEILAAPKRRPERSTAALPASRVLP